MLACLTLAVACAAHADDTAKEKDSSFSIVKKKMTENLDNLIKQGVATLNTLDHSIKPEAEQPASTVIKLKMDKINSRYVENGDEVYDKVTNLTWSRCSFGQRWVKSKGCVGTVKQISFDQAYKFTNAQWRLPTRTELASLINPTKKTTPAALTIDTIAFPDMDLDKLYYWTGTEEDNSFAWAILFVDSGVQSVLYRSHRYAVRMVRTGA